MRSAVPSKSLTWYFHPAFFVVFSHTFKIQTISDSTSVRDVMVLDLPTMATGDISGLYDRQIHTLNALYMKDIHTVRNSPFPNAYIFRQNTIAARVQKALACRLPHQWQGTGDLCCAPPQISGTLFVIIVVRPA